MPVFREVLHSKVPYSAQMCSHFLKQGQRFSLDRSSKAKKKHQKKNSKFFILFFYVSCSLLSGEKNFFPSSPRLTIYVHVHSIILNFVLVVLNLAWKVERWEPPGQEFQVQGDAKVSLNYIFCIVLDLI